MLVASAYCESAQLPTPVEVVKNWSPNVAPSEGRNHAAETSIGAELVNCPNMVPTVNELVGELAVSVGNQRSISASPAPRSPAKLMSEITTEVVPGRPVSEESNPNEARITSSPLTKAPAVGAAKSEPLVLAISCTNPPSGKTVLIEDPYSVPKSRLIETLACAASERNGADTSAISFLFICFQYVGLFSQAFVALATPFAAFRTMTPVPALKICSAPKFAVTGCPTLRHALL